MVCCSAQAEQEKPAPNYVKSMYRYMTALHSLHAEAAGVKKGMYALRKLSHEICVIFEKKVCDLRLLTNVRSA